MNKVGISLLGIGALTMSMPAVPLVVKDPYLNVWQFANNLYDDWARHWTGAIKAITGMIRVDGKAYKFMGIVREGIPAFPQKAVTVLPTRTIYHFSDGNVDLSLTFLTPTLPKDYKTLSLPLTYLIGEISSADGREHEVQLYFDISAEWADGEASRPVVWEGGELEKGIRFFRVKPAEAQVFREINDYPNWGFAIWSAREATSWESGADDVVRGKFLTEGKLSNRMDWRQPRPINERWPVFAYACDLGKVGSKGKSVSFLIGHIREEAISYAGEIYQPLWRRYFADWKEMLSFSWDNLPAIASTSQSFDADLLEKAKRTGGEDYAFLLSLTYRQVLGACEIVFKGEKTVMFMKEISSGSFIQTTDVIFPASPFFLYFNPELLKMQLEPLLEVSESPAWKDPFAPHDLGRYPIALQQSYGAPMPVEESGNMLLMVLAYAKRTNDIAFVNYHFPLLQRWADYLVEKGLEPEEQLCTDDFTGPLALNVNLAGKAIGGVFAFARLAEMVGKKEIASKYESKGKEMLSFWLEKADAKDHLSRVYGQPETWSLKYNMFYPLLCGLDVFPREIIEREVKFYLGKSNRYGIPLDDRFSYTKADWLSWIGFMSVDPSARERILHSLVHFLQESPDKVPFTDWYDTQTGKVVGFRARPVLGAFFALLCLSTEEKSH